MTDSHRALYDYLLWEQVMRWQPILREQAMRAAPK
jgi:hypothetical protein